MSGYYSYALTVVLAIALQYQCKNTSTKPLWEVTGEIGQLNIEMVADSIAVPFGMTFLPNNKMLVTNRRYGKILMVDYNTGVKKTLKDVPPSFCSGDGGALDVLAHPDYNKNGWIYFSHSVGDSLKSTLVVERFKIKKDSVIDIERVFTALPYYDRPNHYGSRMLIKDGYLFVTMGDRYYMPDSAQTLGNHLGKVMRIFEDGTIPKDNPYIDSVNNKPEVWSFGHRNPQGLVFRPETEDLWLHEHGPKGGDEINIIKPRFNYGWPIICHGIDYDDTPIGEGITHKEGLEQPLYHYTPSIAPSGMEFYTGDKYPEWKGNLFIGGMAQRHLNRLVIRNDSVVHEERLLSELEMRIRNVKQSPEGYLYVAVDGGMILRIVPQ